MDDNFQVRLEGVEDLKRALADAAKTIRTKAVRGALREAGKVIQAAARAKAPVLKARTRYRAPGTVKRAISVRVSKAAKQHGDEGVFVGVRPLTKNKIRAAKAAQAKAGGRIGGAYNPNDPYYWWWVEFGHRLVPRSSKGEKTIYGSVTIRRKDGTVYRRVLKRTTTGLRSLRAGASGSVAPRPFLAPAADKGNEAVAKFMASVVPQIEKLNQRKK